MWWKFEEGNKSRGWKTALLWLKDTEIRIRKKKEGKQIQRDSTVLRRLIQSSVCIQTVQLVLFGYYMLSVPSDQSEFAVESNPKNWTSNVGLQTSWTKVLGSSLHRLDVSLASHCKSLNLTRPNSMAYKKGWGHLNGGAGIQPIVLLFQWFC